MNYELRKVLADFLVLIDCWDSGSIKASGIFMTELGRLNQELSDALAKEKLPVIGVED